MWPLCHREHCVPSKCRGTLTQRYKVTSQNTYSSTNPAWKHLIQRHRNPVQALPAHLFKNHFSCINPSTPRFSNWTPPFRFVPPKPCAHFSTCHNLPRTSINHVIFSSILLLLFRAQITSSGHYSRTPSDNALPLMWDTQVSHPYKTVILRVTNVSSS